MYALGVEKILYASCSQELHKRGLDIKSHTQKKSMGVMPFCSATNQQNRLYLLDSMPNLCLWRRQYWSWLAKYNGVLLTVNRECENIRREETEQPLFRNKPSGLLSNWNRPWEKHFVTSPVRTTMKNGARAPLTVYCLHKVDQIIMRAMIYCRFIIPS